MAVATRAVKTEDVVRDAMAPNLSPRARKAWLEDAADSVRRNGVIVVRGAIPQAAVAAVLEHVKHRHDVHMAPGQKKLFRTFQSDPLRAQVPIAIDGPVADPEFFAPPSVLGIVRELMGEDLIVGQMGVVISHAGAGPQEIHRDSAFLFGGLDSEVGLPPYAMSMLVPLLDVPLGMGPTEFWPGTHRRRDEAAASAGPPRRMQLDAGSVLLFDSRLLHRGGANITGPVRPSIYFNLHRSWYQENPGYTDKPQVRVTPAMVQRLPEAYRALFSWALHLNRTDGFQEFVFRWTGRIRRDLFRLMGR
ncbi:phytanoyl-CoA dioxygenase family protein [Phenylobacterium sp.]|uniref:phytanoyl-CoA dioxygenase family protein n=1 Tax=Phenylobacterium sp. TaxID=1871053 RepID=UPI003566126A